ncbi:hypothetical protein ACTHGU_01380 [Chitinophagaceae bacterium MMS25-I14]
MAQNSNKENDPYSRYGIGQILPGTNAVLRGMGNASTAYASPYSVNTDNPASYASLRLTTYEAGGTASMTSVYSGGASYGSGSASLSYLNVGIPVGKHGGLSFGLKPTTHVYYKMEDSINFRNTNPPLQGMGTNSYIYSGDGGLNYAFVGGAYKLGGFSLGVNFGYMFGSIRNSSVIQQADTFMTLSSEFDKYTKVGGLYYKIGAMYETPLNKKMKLRLGATAAFSQSLNTWRDDYYINFNIVDGLTTDDTSYHDPQVKGKLKMPATYSVGAQLIADKWTLNADYVYTNWSQYSNNNIVDTVTSSTYKVGVGAEYTPNPASLYNYFQRVTYRIGGYYGSDYVSLHGNTINYYAVTLGASLPFRRSTDRLHVGMEFGTRGTESNGMIKENFFRFTLGISLNDKWFIKRKYD